MRSVLMLLGVVLHSARPYDSHNWQIKDAVRLPALDGLVAGIHLLRMPAFFVVAGFFALYLLVRRPASVFLRERLRRVLVPLLATLLTFNLAQVWMVVGDGGELGFVRGALLPAWASGRWISHLWFLAVLVVYFVLSAAFAPLLRWLADPQGRAAAWLARRWALIPLLSVAVLAPLVTTVIAKLTGPALNTLMLGAVSPRTLLWYLPYFVVGMLLAAIPGLLDRFARRGPVVIVLAVCGFVGMQLSAGRGEDAYRVAHVVATALLTWMVVRVVFSLFRDWANRPSRTFEYLSYASYSIYLFHHLVVIVTASVLLAFPLGAGLKFAIVLAAASLLPLALHHFLVRRHAWLGYLFNGRVVPRGARVVAPPAAVPAAATGASGVVAGRPDAWPPLPGGPARPTAAGDPES